MQMDNPVWSLAQNLPFHVYEPWQTVAIRFITHQAQSAGVAINFT